MPPILSVSWLSVAFACPLGWVTGALPLKSKATSVPDILAFIYRQPTILSAILRCYLTLFLAAEPTIRMLLRL